MRLFEVDRSSARDVLAVLRSQSDKSESHLTIPFNSVMRLLKPYDLGISTPEGLRSLVAEIDPQGSVIADILDNGSVVLNTKKPNPNQDAAIERGTGPSVDQMASSNAKTL
jgi:hypothetical protein